MKKFLLIFLCLLLLGMGQNSTGFHNQNRELLYKFDYTFQGEVSGVFLLVFRYRFFFYAHASVLLNARVTDQQTIDFQFRDIAEPGIILRSWGFRGKTFLTGVATYNQDKSNALLETDSDMLKKVHPDYLQFVKQWRRCPFVLEPKEKLNLAFSRKENGIHADSVIDMPVTRLCKDDKYYFNFNIYPMMRDLIDAYDHPFFNGEPEDERRDDQPDADQQVHPFLPFPGIGQRSDSEDGDGRSEEPGVPRRALHPGQADPRCNEQPGSEHQINPILP